MEKIKLEDFLKYKFLSGIRYSNDGKHICFSVHEMLLEDNKYISNLYLCNTGSGKVFRLTGLNQESNFLWLKDNEHILFSSLRDPKDREKQEKGHELTQFYKINIHGGEAVQAFRIPRQVGSIKELDGDTYIFSSTSNKSRKAFETLNEDEKEEELKRRNEEKDYEVINEIPFWSNGEGFINGNRNRLYMFNAATGECDPLTDENIDVGGFNLNCDKTKVVFTGQIFKGRMPLTNDIYIYDLSSKSLKRLTEPGKFSFGYVNFMGEDTLLCTGTDMKQYGINENEKFYTLDLKTNDIKCTTPDFDRSLGSSVGSDCRYGRSQSMDIDGSYLYFTTTEGDSSYINRIDLSGNIEKITTSKGSVDGFAVKDGRIYFIGLRDMKLQEIYKIEQKFEEQVTDFNGWVSREKKVVLPESLSFETEPGVVIDGWVMKPADFDVNKSYPAVFDIHGGPKTVYGEVFYHEMQYWANAGYFVFFCNPRGSDGKGNEFADIRGKYGTIDYDDLMKFTDAVLEKYPWIDSLRVGVTGGSYGGFMTNWIIGHTNRFKAAASQRSISNWVSMFATTDIGYYFASDQMAATPWSSSEKLWFHSPLKYADKVQTPTLFIHSQEDYRCWLAEGIQMFTALKYHNVEARLCMFKGENHELSRSGKPKHRARRLKEITTWFDSHLKDE